VTGTFSYNPQSDLGFIRLTIGDTEQSEASFSDEELQAFLTRGASVQEASALAYETWIRNQAKIAQMIEEEGFTNRREAVGELLKLAKAIRDSNLGGRRIATNLNTNDGGYKANVRPLGNIKQDSLEEA
jgi:hypothetical protein